jgi:hypothetical protein
MKTAITIILSFIINQVYSQRDTSKLGLIKIVASAEIEELERNYTNTYSEMQGYRVQIGSESGSSSQARANNTRAQFKKKYPEIETYVVWEAPNYKVRVGDFRTKVEASLFWKAIQDDFPNSYVVGDKIVLIKIEKK